MYSIAQKKDWKCVFTLTHKYTLGLLLKLIHMFYRIRKQTAELLHRINPLAAGMTECERGRCRTRSRLAGWTHILGMVAQNMSQWMADHRRRDASEVGSHSLVTTKLYFPSWWCFLLSSPFSLGIRCSCLSVYSLYRPIWYLYIVSVSFLPHLSLLLCTPLSLTLWLQNRQSEKQHLAF